MTACSGGGGATTTAPPAATLSAISVTPGTPSVAAGLTQQLKAAGQYSDGSSHDITASVTWSSGSASVATISASGLVTSKAPGTAVITATSGTVSGTATLTVGPAVLSSIAVSPATVQLGSTQQMKATGTFTDQSTQDLSSTAEWSAANGYVASVSATGVVSSVGTGSTAVTAAQSGVKGSGDVTVLASPRYLYVAGLGGRTISRMAVDGTSGQPRFAGYREGLMNNIGFACLTIDPARKHAYLSAQTLVGSSLYAGTVAIFSIDEATGTLTALAGSPFSVPMALGCLSFAPSGKFAYAVNGILEAPNALGLFAVNADATLTLNSTIPLNNSPMGFAVDPLGQYLYVNTLDVPSGTAGASALYGYRIDATTGGLTAVDGSPWTIPPGTAGHLAFHPSGNFLYASDGNAYNILEYTVDRATGGLTGAATVSSTCINPSALQFLPDGSHAYALCGESGGRSVLGAPIVEYAVGSGGQLTAKGLAVAGAAAEQMQVDEAGKFLYVLGSGSDTQSAGNNSYYAPANMVLAFQVQADGSLKLANEIAGHVLGASMALLSGPAPVTWTTTNAYVTTSGDSKMTPYAVAADGTLTAGTSMTTATGPFSGSMLPWGSDLLFATQTTMPNLFGYAVSGGAIANGTSFGSATSPGGIVIDPRGTWAYATDPAGGVVDLFFQGIPGYWFPVYASTTGTAPYTFAAGAGAGPITMDPSGRYVVTANQTEKSLSLIEPLGAAPTPNTMLSFTPLTVTVDATGNYIFVAGDDGQLHMFRSDGLGTLTDKADGALLGTNTVSVAVDPTSRFVYAAGPAGLNAFTMNTAAQTMAPLSLNLGVSLQNATGVYIEPAGKYLYVSVSNGTSNALYAFTINGDGTLTASGANPVAAPNHATSMVFQATVQ